MNLIEYYNTNLIGKKLTQLQLSHPEFYNELMDNTKQFGDISLSNRIWLLLNDFAEPLCKQCGLAKTKWNKTPKTYRDFCSSRCSNKNNAKQQKCKETCLEKYGVTSTVTTQTCRDNLTKHYACLPKIEIANSVSVNNWRELYPDKHLMQIPEFSKRIGYNRQVNLYGVDVAEKLNNKQWLIQKNHIEKLSLSEIGELLGVPITTISKIFIKHDITPKYHYVSGEEKQLAQFLDSLQIKYNTSVRNIIKGELDFYLPDYKIAIEYCGLYWHSNLHKPNDYHYNKWKMCNDLGIRLITIFQNEWIYKTDIVKDKLSHILNKSTKNIVYARKCTVINNIDKKILCKFYNTNHIQGYVSSKHSYGLLFNGELVAAMSFRQNVGDYELVRFATNKIITGGFSKLFKYAKLQLQNKPIKTFSDMRWDTGDIYIKNNFAYDGFVKPDYAYIRNDMLWHKFNFRHKQLSKMDGYDPTLSESKNTKKMNIHKIYDCGKKRYLFK